MRASTAYPVHCAGRLADALRLTEEGLELTGEDPSVGAGIAYACPHAILLFLRAMMLGFLGRLPEGFANVELALQVGRKVNDLEVQGWAHALWPWLAHWAGGDADLALAHARRGVEVTERTGGAFSRAHAYASLAEAHLLGRAWDAAEVACLQALALMHSNHTCLENEPMVHLRLARARLGAGRVAEAGSAAEDGLRLSRERGHVIAEVQARSALTQVLLAEAAPDATRIRSELNEALALTERTGFLSCQPQIHLRRAELARLTGDDERAAQAFDLAYRQFTAIGAEGWAKEMAAR